MRDVLFCIILESISLLMEARASSLNPKSNIEALPSAKCGLKQK